MPLDTAKYERRTVSHAGLELRSAPSATSGPDSLLLEGYAATFGVPYNLGPFWEQVERRAFDRTLSHNPDVRLLVDHVGQPLARTKSGTLKLTTDDRGLRVSAELDPTDPDVQRLRPKMARGDLDEMSFAFGVPTGGDSWDYGERTLRSLLEVSLAGGDVSVVTYPANPDTSTSLQEVRSVYLERAAREFRAGRLPQAELLKVTRTVEQIMRDQRALTANDTKASLAEAVNTAYGELGYAFVADYDADYVYFTVWDGDDEDSYRQGYTLAGDGMASLAGTREAVRARTTWTPVTDPDAAEDDAELAAVGATEARSATPGEATSPTAPATGPTAAYDLDTARRLAAALDL